MTDPRPNSKVARVIEAHDLNGLGDRLEAKWTGADGDRTSLRDLADEFNRRVVEAALREAGASIVDADVASTYETLTGNDVQNADRMRKRRGLEQDGIDVDSLLENFVTHQAIHTYLTKYRDAELPDRSEHIVDRKIQALERLQGRTVAVAESTVDGLASAGEITAHEYEIFVDVRAVCSDCGTDYPVSTLLREGGCDCGAS